MPVKFDCPECGRAIRAPDHIAGKKTRCPGCTHVILVPKNADPGFEVVEEESTPTGQQIEPSAVERRPCPACGESIAVKAKKCRFCGEEFDGRSRKKDLGNLRRKYNSQMNGLGGLWIFLSFLFLLAAVVLACGEAPAHVQRPTHVMVLVGVFGFVWLLAGIGTCFKYRWAVYVGLSASYLCALGYVVTLRQIIQAPNGPQTEFTAGVVIGLLLMVVGILQGHRVNGMAKRLNSGDDN